MFYYVNSSISYIIMDKKTKLFKEHNFIRNIPKMPKKTIQLYNIVDK